MPTKTTPQASPSTRESSQPSTPMTLKTRLSIGSNASPSSLNTSISLIPRELTIDPDAAIENISLRDDFLEHSTLVEIILNLGYNINKNGICHGYSNLAKNAILAGEFDKFEKRKKFINNNSPGSIVKALRKVKEKLKNNEPLDKNDENYLELMIFFDNIVISQDPSRAAHLFTGIADLYQGSEASRKLVESVSLQKKGGEKELITMPAVFNRQELVDFLREYEKICLSLQLTEPISLQFGAVEHAINVTYIPKTKKWILVDANVFKNPRQNADFATHHFDDVMHVANKLFNNYVNLVPNHNKPVVYLGMTIKAYATGKNSKARGFSDALKNTRLYNTLSSPKNRAKAERTDLQNNTFLHIAARIPGYSPSSINFNEHGKNLDIKDHKGNTALLVAISLGNIELAKALLKAGADPKIENNIGISPLFIAECTGQEGLAKALIECGATPTFNLDKLIPYACENFEKDMLTFLIKVQKADINKSYPFVEKQNLQNTSTHTKYIPPLIYALNHNNYNLAEFLIANDANAAVGLEWAIRTNNISAFDFLIHKIPNQDPKVLLVSFLAEAMKANDTVGIAFLAKAINELYFGKESPFGDLIQLEKSVALDLIKLKVFTYLDFIKALDQDREDLIEAMLAHPEHLLQSASYCKKLSSENSEKLPQSLRKLDLAALPVIIAASKDNYDLTERLLALDFTPNTDHPQMMPAMHHAVENNNKKMVRLLLDAGANKKAKYRNQTAYHLAVDQDKNKIASVINPVKIRRRVSPIFSSPESQDSNRNTSPPINKRKDSSDSIDNPGVTFRKKRQKKVVASPDRFRNVNTERKYRQ